MLRDNFLFLSYQHITLPTPARSVHTHWICKQSKLSRLCFWLGYQPIKRYFLFKYKSVLTCLLNNKEFPQIKIRFWNSKAKVPNMEFLNLPSSSHTESHEKLKKTSQLLFYGKIKNTRWGNWISHKSYLSKKKTHNYFSVKMQRQNFLHKALSSFQDKTEKVILFKIAKYL